MTARGPVSRSLARSGGRVPATVPRSRVRAYHWPPGPEPSSRQNEETVEGEADEGFRRTLVPDRTATCGAAHHAEADANPLGNLDGEGDSGDDAGGCEECADEYEDWGGHGLRREKRWTSTKTPKDQVRCLRPRAKCNDSLTRLKAVRGVDKTFLSETRSERDKGYEAMTPGLVTSRNTRGDQEPDRLAIIHIFCPNGPTSSPPRCPSDHHHRPARPSLPAESSRAFS